MKPIRDDLASTAPDSPHATRREGASFRDPSGFIFRRDGIVYRQVNQRYAETYRHLTESGFYRKLIERNDLIATEEVDEAPAADGAFKILRPRQLGFISYPYEWCFSQLKDAALLTLHTACDAFAQGITLKDASAYNVQFERGRPILIDTLSFDLYREGEPWIAYGQFCRHFLAPLALMAKKDVRLGQLLRIHLDGIPLDLASGLLPRRTRFSLGLGLHLHAHAATQLKHAGLSDRGRGAPACMTRQAMRGLIDNLISTVESLQWKPPKTEWDDYYQSNNNYGESGLKEKETALRHLLDGISYQTIWDLGGNTGRFSRIAAEKGASVVCWDIDPACVEANYRHVKSNRETNIFPALLDLTNPSPSLGWAHAERASLTERGPVDLVLALGLIHHLAISNNVPLDRVAELLARLCKTLIIEFVPKEDSQVAKLLASREDIFSEYHREGFESAFSRYFQIEASQDISGTVRRLYRMGARAVP